LWLIAFLDVAFDNENLQILRQVHIYKLIIGTLVWHTPSGIESCYVWT